MFHRCKPMVSRVLALVLCLLLLLCACGPATSYVGSPRNAPANTDIPAEPARAVANDSFTIALPTSATADDKDAFHAFLQRLQNLLWKKGWRATLVEVPMPDSQSYEAHEEELINTIRTQAATGKGPDAWRVSPDFAKRLRAQGLTQDMATVMPTASPMLWDLCKESFRDGADGVPAVLSTRTKGEPNGLMMSAAQLQAYGAPITNADDVLTFLEKKPDASIWAVDVSILTEAWAAQQGYYSLANYGLPPYFYAKMEDADCMPVPAEDIVNFDEFFRRWTALWQEGRLHDANEGYARTYIGVLSVLGGVDARMLQQAMGLQGEDIVALPLDGCNQSPPVDPPICSRMLAVPAASQQASTVAAFAQWMLLDREGHDLCNYGQQDVDYRLEDERVEYLNAGAPLSDADWDFDPKNLAAPFYQYTGALGFYSEMLRVQKGCAANLEQALAQCKVEAPPLWCVKALRKDSSYLHDIFATTTQPYESVFSQHVEDVSYLVETYNGVPQRTADKVLQRLRGNRPKLDPLIHDLSIRLKQFLDNPDADATETATP